jgi:hypothetical protein
MDGPQVPKPGAQNDGHNDRRTNEEPPAAMRPIALTRAQRDRVGAVLFDREYFE